MKTGKTQSYTRTRIIKMAIDAALERSTERLRLARIMYNDKDYNLFKTIYYKTIEIKEDEKTIYLYGAVGVKKLLDDWKEVYDIILENAQYEDEGFTHPVRFETYIEKNRIVKGKTTVLLDYDATPEDDPKIWEEGQYFSVNVIRGGKNIYSLMEWIEFSGNTEAEREQARAYTEQALEKTGLLLKDPYKLSIATQLALYILGG